MKKCPLCGDTIYSEDDVSICHRCRESGGHVRLEIYDDIDKGKEAPKGFSDIYMGGLNYKTMRGKNIRRGGFS